jgi:DNA-directed RNA polymerase delta subunit
MPSYFRTSKKNRPLNKKFYYFEDTTKFVANKILEHMSIENIIAECLHEYEIDEADLKKNITEFYQLLLHEGIIHEN